LVILIRFCWGFKTPKEEYQDKKIKGKDPSKKKNKLLRNEKAPPMLDEELKTNERLKNPAVVQTATSL
jgi:hypothetical protein